MFLPFAQLCATPYHRMLGATQTGTSKNQRRNSRVISARSPKKPPLSNHKGKGVVAVVICTDPGEDEEERPTLPIAVSTTLQKSSRFKNLFDQLELIVNEQRIAIEALVSIAQGAGVECLSVEARADKAFLQDKNEITFSDEDIEVGYSDQRKPLYLVASINQIPIKKALVDMGASINLIPLGTLQARRISKRKIQGCPIRNGNRSSLGYVSLYPDPIHGPGPATRTWPDY